MNSAIRLKKPSAIVAMLLVLGVAACGGDDSEGSNDGGAGSTGVAGGDGSASKDGAGGRGWQQRRFCGEQWIGRRSGRSQRRVSWVGWHRWRCRIRWRRGDERCIARLRRRRHLDADACASLGALVAPTVPDALKPPAELRSQRFRATGFQVYTCTPSGDGGADSGVTFSWVVVPDASLYNDSCIKVGMHLAARPGSRALTVARVVGVRVGSADVTNAIPLSCSRRARIREKASSLNVTAIQRLNTTGGVAPSAASCNASTLGQSSSVAYTATYYFYTGGTWPVPEAGSDASDAAATVPDATTDAASEAATDAGSDASSDAAVTDAGSDASSDAEVTDAGEGG